MRPASVAAVPFHMYHGQSHATNKAWMGSPTRCCWFFSLQLQVVISENPLLLLVYRCTCTQSKCSSSQFPHPSSICSVTSAGIWLQGWQGALHEAWGFMLTFSASCPFPFPGLHHPTRLNPQSQT